VTSAFRASTKWGCSRTGARQRRITSRLYAPLVFSEGRRPSDSVHAPSQRAFWSEDSTTIVYGARGRLWKVQVSGGTPALLSTLRDSGWDQGASGAWTADGGSVYTNGSSALWRVPAAGGDPVTVVPLANPEDLHFHRIRHALSLNRADSAFALTRILSAAGELVPRQRNVALIAQQVEDVPFDDPFVGRR
jgi:hypothetical protein